MGGTGSSLLPDVGRRVPLAFPRSGRFARRQLGVPWKAPRVARSIRARPEAHVRIACLTTGRKSNAEDRSLPAISRSLAR